MQKEQIAKILLIIGSVIILIGIGIIIGINIAQKSSGKQSKKDNQNNGQDDPVNQEFAFSFFLFFRKNKT